MEIGCAPEPKAGRHVRPVREAPGKSGHRRRALRRPEYPQRVDGL